MLYVVAKKSRFIKEQQASGLLNSLGVETPLRKIRYSVIFFSYFECNSIEWNDLIVVITVFT